AFFGIFSMANAQTPASSQQVRQVEIVTFKPGTSDSSKHMVDKSFREAADAFSTVKAFEWGWDASNKVQPKHVYVTTFNSKGDLTTYTSSPQHQAVLKSAPIASVTTVNYSVNQ
ncbi:MAG TPA: Dabb family protein, partial [Puia sp.]|nr:Dabb family protein [Puia sp.]